MGAFTDLSDLINRLSGGNSGTPEHIWFQKYAQNNGTSRTQGSTGSLAMSMWLKDGCPGFPTAGPGAVAIPDNTTLGGLLQTNPGGGRSKWLLGADFFANDTGTGPTCYLLYDRLLHKSGLDGTILTAQAVQSAGVPALTRYTDGVGNFAFFEVYTAIGTTAGRTATISYTDNDGNSGQVSQPVVIGGAASTGASAVGQANIFPLLSGDKGVRGVASVTISATTGGAGDFGITIGHPIALILVAQTGGPSGHKDMVLAFPSVTEVKSNACLALLQVAVGQAAVQTGQPLLGALHFCEA